MFSGFSKSLNGTNTFFLKNDKTLTYVFLGFSRLRSNFPLHFSHNLKTTIFREFLGMDQIINEVHYLKKECYQSSL